MIPSSHRLLIEARLQPRQGHRFQSAEFPESGAGEYLLPDGTMNLLVDSIPSVANRLEAMVWDAPSGDVIPELRGMPYARLRHPQHGVISSLTEAHRLASPYLFPWLQKELAQEMGTDGKRPVEHSSAARALLRRCPGCLLHGVFLLQAKPIVRITRILSGFIEAHDVMTVLTGGVKFDRVDPSGPAAQGKGHVPFDRTEYTAREIVAYFNLDLHELRAYRLSEAAERFLFDLALFKIVRFLDRGLRLRTACDLRAVSVTTEPEIEIPAESVLAARLGKSLRKLSASGELANPAIWELEPC